MDTGGVVNVFGFGGMPPAVARRNIDVYAEQVLPALRTIDTFRDVATPAPA